MKQFTEPEGTQSGVRRRWRLFPRETKEKGDNTLEVAIGMIHSQLLQLKNEKDLKIEATNTDKTEATEDEDIFITAKTEANKDEDTSMETRIKAGADGEGDHDSFG